MKKSIFALMGLFTLVACGDDAYQEVPQKNKAEGFPSAFLFIILTSSYYSIPLKVQYKKQ